MAKNNSSTYSVWVGGIEVNDVLLTKDEAIDLANEYEAKGYDDVVIDDYTDEN